MQLHSLPSTTKTSHKRGGQGHGSGRGKTSGRGTKGQKARRNIPLHFDGANLPILERMPKLRGKSRNKPFKNKPVIVDVVVLNRLPKGSTVDLEMLIKHNMINVKDAKADGVKILGSGKVTQVLTIVLPISKGAKEQIEKAGGTIKASSV